MNTTIPTTVDRKDLSTRLMAAMATEWHFKPEPEKVEGHVAKMVLDGQAMVEYQRGEYTKQIWLVAGTDGLTAGLGKTPERLHAEILVRWSETEPTSEEEVTYTTAHVDYDWMGTRTLAIVGNDKRGKVIRKVAGPKNRVEAQRGRYGSGNNLVADETEWQKLVSYKLVELI